MKQLLKWFDAWWLPAFLLLSTSWLLAPALHHGHYGDLVVISSYEGMGQPWAWAFRLCDTLAAAVLNLAFWRYRVFARDRLLGGILGVMVLLTLIDGVFPIGCVAACTPWERFSWGLHDVESAVLAVMVIVSAALVFLRTRHWLGIGLIVTQLAMGLAALSGFFPHRQLMVLHFAYQLSVVAWLAWLLSYYAPEQNISKRAKTVVRRFFMWTTILVGVLVLAVTTARNRALGHILETPVAHLRLAWLTRHGVLAGLLLLYIARHIGKGQRRAAIVLAAVLSTLIFVYSLFRPQPLLLVVSMVLIALLWHYSSAFTRNVGFPPLVSRLKDFAVVLAGVLAAGCVIAIVAIATGRQATLLSDIYHIYQQDAGRLSQREKRLPERYERRLRTTLNTLSVGLIVLLAWTLFRPSGKKQVAGSDERDKAHKLLLKYSNSSEDYFKLWPPDKQYFFSQTGEGMVAYKISGTVAFALADPIAAPNRRAALVQAFTEFCRTNGWHACFLLVQENSVRYYQPELALLQIGSSAVIDVREFAEVTSRDKWWRWQANRARKAGHRYEALQPPHSQELLAELHSVSNQWLAHGGRREQGFALGYFDETYLQECTVHALRDAGGTLLAFANEVPTFREPGHRTIDLMRFTPDAPGAISALLMHVLQHWHTTRSVATFDLGFVPLAKLDSVPADIARRLSAGRFSAGGLAQFKDKFRPAWRPNYIAYDGDVLDLTIILPALTNALKPPPGQPE